MIGPMDIRQITPDFAAGPQIEPADMAALAEAGFTTVINNRPDAEIPPDLQWPPRRRGSPTSRTL